MGREIKELERERHETVAELERLYSYMKSEPDMGGDEVDLDVYEREKNLALIQTLERKLKAIDRALRSAEKGGYGICERCGQRIDPARLRALPHTTLCIGCKSRLERMNRSGFRRS